MPHETLPELLFLPRNETLRELSVAQAAQQALAAIQASPVESSRDPDRSAAESDNS
jgi:hypothetical protein